MERSRYIDIRKAEDFSHKPGAIYLYWIQDLLLLAILGSLWYFVSGIAAKCVLGTSIVAVLMFRNFSQMHDAVHGASAKNRRLNDVVGMICGAISLLPFKPWKKVHLEHHYWSGNIDRDPVMAILRTYPKWPSVLKAFLSACWRLWIPTLSMTQYLVFWFHSAKQCFKSREALKSMGPSLVLPFAAWGALLVFAPSAFLLGALLPGVLVYFVAVEVVNFPHHLELPQLRGDSKLPIWNQYEVSRSCIYPKWFAHFVVMNFNFHSEHHMFPDLPWYHLDKVQKMVSEELEGKYNTDPRWAWIIKNRPKHLSEVFAPASKYGNHHPHDVYEGTGKVA
jgi:fatty acid desaturase